MSGSANAVVSALDDLRNAMPAAVPWALIGGMAVSARAEPRFTRDVDVAVVVRDDESAEALAAAMMSKGWSVGAVVEQEATGRLAQVRLATPGISTVVCDLLFASSGIEAEVVRAAEPLEIAPGLTVPVARTGHLLVLKLLSVDERRLQDRLDLAALAAVADDEEWRLAERAARLVTARGYGRGRDLATALEEWRAGPGPASLRVDGV